MVAAEGELYLDALPRARGALKGGFHLREREGMEGRDLEPSPERNGLERRDSAACVFGLGPSIERARWRCLRVLAWLND